MRAGDDHRLSGWVPWDEWFAAKSSKCNPHLLQWMLFEPDDKDESNRLHKLFADFYFNNKLRRLYRMQR